MEKNLFIPPEASAYLGGIITVKTLAEWRSTYNRTGRNPGPKFIRLGGKIGYRRTDLDKWLVHNEVDSDRA